MKRKVAYLINAREEKRRKAGWTLEEIKKKAAEDYEKYREVSKEHQEPEAFHSGDMKRVLEGRDDDDNEINN